MNWIINLDKSGQHTNTPSTKMIDEKNLDTTSHTVEQTPNSTATTTLSDPN